MTAEQAIDELKDLEHNDPESGHIKADQILCELLTSLGHPEVVAAWNKVSKWYA